MYVDLSQDKLSERLGCGQQVRIVQGCVAGLTARCVRRDGLRWLIMPDGYGPGVYLEVEADWLEPIDASPSVPAIQHPFGDQSGRFN